MKKLLLTLCASFLGTLQLNICASAATATAASAAESVAQAKEAEAIQQRLNNMTKFVLEHGQKHLTQATTFEQQIKAENKPLYSALINHSFFVGDLIKSEIFMALLLIYLSLKAEIESLKKSSGE